MNKVPKHLLRTDGEIASEYRLLQKHDRHLNEVTSKTRGKRGDDRYSDVLPYSRNNIRLLHPTEFSNDGYINASLIDSLGGDVRYIATQGPLAKTVGPFWQLCFEEIFRHKRKIVNVIMLTEIHDGGREKCHDYVNSIEKDVVAVGNGLREYGISDVRYVGLEKFNNDGVEVRKFRAEYGKVEVTLRHVWIRNWPDFSVPDNANDNNNFVVKYLNRTSVDIEEQYQSYVVHCSAGVGRSGVFISLDYYYRYGVLKQLLDNGVDDRVLFRLVLSLRKCRTMMVQRPEQYHYLYKACTDFFRDP